MAARRSRKRRNGGRRNRDAASGVLWGSLLAVMVAVLATGGYFAWSFTSSRPSIDEATLCPDTGPSGVFVVLLDLTDPLTPRQGARLRTILDDRISQLPQGTMISFGVVSNDESRMGSLYSSCKPADGSAASQLYENPALITARFQRDFMEPMRAGLDEAMRAGTEDRSPIMESLQALVSETPAFETSARSRELLIVSDLLQHSDVLSFYRGEGWERLRERGGIERLARTLTDAKVSIFKVPRPSAPETARNQVDEFWTRYFDMQGARVPDMRVLGDL